MAELTADERAAIAATVTTYRGHEAGLLGTVERIIDTHTQRVDAHWLEHCRTVTANSDEKVRLAKAEAASHHLRAVVAEEIAEPFGVLAEVLQERVRQNEKWGQQDHEDGTGYAYLREKAELARRQCEFEFAAGLGSWRLILREEFAEALACTDPLELRTELIQVAAVAVQWVEAIDRRLTPKEADRG